jgi:integrase
LSTARIKLVFVVAYHLGMRTDELLALKRGWVDLEEGLIYVNGRMTKNRNPKTAPIYGDIKPGSKWSRQRTSRIAEICLALLTRRQTGERLQSGWKQACEKAGVPGLLFHDLRRLAVRNMIRAGVPDKIAMQISGHKTARMLWRYNITNPPDIKDAGKRTERYLETQRGQQHAQTLTQYFGTS